MAGIVFEANSPTFVDPSKVHLGKFAALDLVAVEHYNGLVDAWCKTAAERHQRIEEIPTETHDGLGLRFEEVTLYHGSSVPDIGTFQPAEEHTIGRGLYATSMPDKAFGYARIRSTDKAQGVAYGLELADVTFLDLRSKANVARFMPDFADYLEFWLEHIEPLEEHNTHVYSRRMYRDEIAQKAITTIRSGKLRDGNLKQALRQVGTLFTEYVLSRGFDGVIAYEGGESLGGDEEIGHHDSWVIMKPDSAKVTKTAIFSKFVIYDHVAADAIKRRRKELGLEWWQKLPEELEAK